MLLGEGEVPAKETGRVLPRRGEEESQLPG